MPGFFYAKTIIKMQNFKIRIDWSDLDVFGHVNNVAFFKYIQAARVNFCESIGLTSLNEKNKLSFIVATTNCTFKKPLHFPGEITIISEVDWIKNSSFQLNHTIYNLEGEVAAEGSDILVIFDYNINEKVTITNDLKNRMDSNGSRQQSSK